MSKIMTPEGVLNSVVEGINKGEYQIKLGTSILNIVVRSPIICSKALSTIDLLSSGRLFAAGVMRLHFWPIRDFEKQIEIFRKEIQLHIIRL